MDSLTPREIEVVQLIAIGMANKEIAAALTISERTVQTHISNILTKLHVYSRTQAAVLVMDTLVDLDAAQAAIRERVHLDVTADCE